MSVYLFPGQGSQIPGMGAALFEAFPELVEVADDILGYSVKALCLDDSKGRLDDTRYTQPAIFVVNALFYEMKRIEARSFPTAMAGHSLGEYNALHAAGAIGFADALRVVKARGELMSQAAGGAMAAVMGIDSKALQVCLVDNDLHAIDIANYNSPLQTVISGPADLVLRSELVLAKNGATFVPLKISAAFHSRYMEPFREAFRSRLDQIGFAAPVVPVIGNVHAQPHALSTMADMLAKHLTHPVRWIETMQYLFELGERQFEEIGPGEVLTKLVSRNLGQVAGKSSICVTHQGA